MQFTLFSKYSMNDLLLLLLNTLYLPTKYILTWWVNTFSHRYPHITGIARRLQRSMRARSRPSRRDPRIWRKQSRGLRQFAEKPAFDGPRDRADISRSTCSRVCRFRVVLFAVMRPTWLQVVIMLMMRIGGATGGFLCWCFGPQDVSNLTYWIGDTDVVAEIMTSSWWNGIIFCTLTRNGSKIAAL